MLTTIHLLYTSVFGLLLGSFLNVVIARLPQWLMWQWTNDAREFLDLEIPSKPRPPGIVVRRSFCPHCQHQLSWWENIPVVSYCLLRGRCRSCRQSISWQYPLVEIAMSVLAVVCVVVWGWNFTGLMAIAVSAVLLVCAGIDFRTQLLPDQIVLPALWSALLWSLTPYTWVSPVQSILGAAIGYMSLWSVFWLFKLITGKEGMGYGDFKLSAVLGAFFGPLALLPILFAACFIGCVVGIVLLKVRNGSQPFAFGPYLGAGGVIYLIWGTTLLSLLTI